MQDGPLQRFIASARDLGFHLAQEPTALPVPGSEWCSGHEVVTIDEPVLGFAMVMQDLQDTKQMITCSARTAAVIH
jgi:hypothetical protein